ncbi:MAG TPA: glycoside hydrolase family 15 protein, partial [Actinomycetota bacterium]
VLVLPLLDLEPRDSPRVRATIAAVRHQLSAGGALLYRYPPGRDGLPGTEGAFLPCSFWLVQALATTGQVDEATQLFDDLLDLTNPLGLLPEELNPTSQGYLGNYPQALTHAALIQAALAIRDAHNDRPDRIIGNTATAFAQQTRRRSVRIASGPRPSVVLPSLLDAHLGLIA